MTIRIAPTLRQLEAALNLLSWLFEHTDDGASRDEISHVRALLWDLVEDR